MTMLMKSGCAENMPIHEACLCHFLTSKNLKAYSGQILLYLTFFVKK